MNSDDDLSTHLRLFTFFKRCNIFNIQKLPSITPKRKFRVNIEMKLDAKKIQTSSDSLKKYRLPFRRESNLISI